MRAFERLADLFGGIHGRGGAHFGLGAGAEAGLAERNHDVGARTVQRLLVGVGSDEGNALRLFVDHVLDGIAAAAAHTDNLDAGVKHGLFHIRSKIKGHSLLPSNP